MAVLLRITTVGEGKVRGSTFIYGRRVSVHGPAAAFNGTALVSTSYVVGFPTTFTMQKVSLDWGLGLLIPFGLSN